MIYLGLNCGMGNHDCATLPKSALDLKEGNFDYPRPKTGVLRWAPLWPETVKALKAVADVAREAKDSADADLFFLTKAGHAWYRENSSDDPIAKEMAKLLQACGMKKLGLGFYALRHTFLTVAEGARDQKAVEFIMGHAPDSNDMTAHYREEMKRERLKKVTDHVRKWLLAGKPKRKQSAA
jgi:integrase